MSHDTARTTNDFSPLKHHTAGPGQRLTQQQREDNKLYNAAVAARAEMLGEFAGAGRHSYKGTSNISDASRKVKEKRVKRIRFSKRKQKAS